MPNWPQRGANQKFGSDNDVWSQKLNFFGVKNPLQIQFEKKKKFQAGFEVGFLGKKSWVYGFKHHYLN